MSAKDKTTIVYQLTEPNPSFLNQLALWTSYPVKQDVVEKFGDKWTEAENHIGNGAFTLRPGTTARRSSSRRTRTTAVKRSRSSAGSSTTSSPTTPPPTPPTWPVSWMSYRAPAARKDVTSPASALSDQLRRQPELGTFGMFMNEAMKPFDNVNVRKAFAQAIDRDALIEGVLQGAGQPATSWIPPRHARLQRRRRKKPRVQRGEREKEPG